jgi:hypothetical protein
MLKRRAPGEERAILLAAATPQEWDEWLNAEAEGGAHVCLMCRAYEGNCYACTGIDALDGNHPCSTAYATKEVYNDFFDRFEAVVERLELAGIWEDECSGLTEEESP